MNPLSLMELTVRLAALEERVDSHRLGVATKQDLDRFATKQDLERFATKQDLERFATKQDLEDKFDQGIASIGEMFDSRIDAIFEGAIPNLKKRRTKAGLRNKRS